MSITNLLSDFRARGIRLTAEGERLTYGAPAGALTPELREKIKAHKAELLATLNQQAANTDPAGLCPKCGSGQYWQLPGGLWHCRACTPMSEADNRRATTLTLLARAESLRRDDTVCDATPR